MEAYCNQVKAIEAAWPELERFYGKNIVRTVTSGPDGPSYRPFAEIASKMLPDDADADRPLGPWLGSLSTGQLILPLQAGSVQRRMRPLAVRCHPVRRDRVSHEHGVVPLALGAEMMRFGAMKSRLRVKRTMLPPRAFFGLDKLLLAYEVVARLRLHNTRCC
jgi:hypothetical protein